MSQLRYWDLSKVQCTLLTAEKTSNIYDSELEQLKIPIEVLLPDSEASPILRTAKSIGCFKKYIYAHSCDIIYLNLANAVAMECARIARRAGIPRVIVHSHCAGIRPGRGHIFKMLAHQIMKKRNAKYATDWWACSEQAASFLFTEDNLPKVQFVSNGIEAKEFQFNEQKRIQKRNELGIGNERIKVIGTVGRCSSEKNQQFLLRTFFFVHRKCPNTKLLIVGDGPLKSELEQYAQCLEIDKECIFYGHATDTASLYCAIDIFCLPSTTESFGIAALEAQAAGCVCLLADNIPKGTKILSNTQFLQLKEKQWADAIINCIEDRIQSEGREHTFLKVRECGLDISMIAPNVQKKLMNI